MTVRTCNRRGRGRCPEDGSPVRKIGATRGLDAIPTSLALEGVPAISLARGFLPRGPKRKKTSGFLSLALIDYHFRRRSRERASPARSFTEPLPAAGVASSRLRTAWATQASGRSRFIGTVCQFVLQSLGHEYVSMSGPPFWTIGGTPANPIRTMGLCCEKWASAANRPEPRAHRGSARRAGGPRPERSSDHAGGP